MTSYGQFCPVAKAMEVLDERWTILIVREMLLGSRHYNDLRRGVPRMSPALLSKRLRSLERVGVVRRDVTAGRTFYTLTRAGEELRPLVESLSAWGMRWIGELGDQDLDAHLLLWDMQRTMPLAEWPRQRTTLEMHLVDPAGVSTHWWIVASGDRFETCDFDPGYEVTASLSGSLRTLVRVWRGEVSWDAALASGELLAAGVARQHVPRWIGTSVFALAPAQ
ncbi:MAG: helix-turn-helix transcriptional regulator [Salinibacterium sp.]|nr:helix-turn-helix domain-containing protein [Salinibacterium sp.]MBF0672141.1 helix-turn-helix transcriptional regulator [Salinibacterium sp.]